MRWRGKARRWRERGGGRILLGRAAFQGARLGCEVDGWMDGCKTGEIDRRTKAERGRVLKVKANDSSHVDG